MKNENLRSLVAIAVMAWSLGGVLAQESKKTENVEASKEARERDSSSKNRRVRIMKAFDRNKDGDLNEEEREALRRYIESRSSKSVGDKKRDDKIEVPKDYDPIFSIGGDRAPPIRGPRKISIIGNSSTNATVKWMHKMTKLI